MTPLRRRAPESHGHRWQNYFKLRDLGKALDFYVSYSSQAGVFLESDQPYSEQKETKAPGA